MRSNKASITFQIPNIEALDTNEPESPEVMVKEDSRQNEEANKDVSTEEVSAKSKVVYREKPSGGNLLRMVPPQKKRWFS